jgi:hypothetical protein
MAKVQYGYAPRYGAMTVTGRASSWRTCVDDERENAVQVIKG